MAVASKILIGKKIGMTQIFDETGAAVPVTVIQAGSCSVLELNNEAASGGSSIVVGYGDVKESKLNQAQKGHFAKLKQAPKANVREFKFSAPDYSGSSDGEQAIDAGATEGGVGAQTEIKAGAELTVAQFKADDRVDVRGKTKGRGFSGTIKRWNFRRGPMSHGSKSHRIPGSIGGGTYPGKVIKGKKMAGRYGNENVTIKNLRVVQVDTEKRLLFLEGAVPGPKNGMIEVRG